MYCIIQNVVIFTLQITNKDEHYYVKRIGGYFKSKRIYL